MVASLSYYVRNTVYDEETFTIELEGLFVSGAGADFIAERFTERLFAIAGVERPEDQDGALAGLVERTLETRTPRAVEAVLSGSGGATVDAAMVQVHRDLMLALQDQSAAIGGDGTILLDLQPVFLSTIDELTGTSSLEFLTEAEVRSDAGVIEIVRRPQGGELLWSAADTVEQLLVPALFFTLGFIVLALGISPARASTVKVLSAGMAVLSLFLAGVAWVARGVYPILVDDSSAARAAQDAHARLTGPYIRVQLIIGAIAVIVFVAAAVLDIYFARREEDASRMSATPVRQVVPGA